MSPLLKKSEAGRRSDPSRRLYGGRRRLPVFTEPVSLQNELPGGAWRAVGSRLREQRWISGLPAPVVALLCFLLLAAAGYADWVTGPDLQSSLPYLLPIIVAGLRFRWLGGLIVAAAATLLTHRVNGEDLAKRISPAVLAINTFTETTIFALTALVTGTLQTQRQRLQAQRRELAAAQSRLQEDLRAAELLQSYLLRRPLPETPELELAVQLRFARGVGGDFYDLRRLDRFLFLCLADVSGKGPRAALISAALRSLLDEMAARLAPPDELLRHLNVHFHHALPDGMFVTMFCGLLDLEQRKLVYASAGHDPPLVRRAAGVERLSPTAPMLGVLPEIRGGTASCLLGPGDMLLLYTDGLTTARWREGERVGEERLVEWLRETDGLSSPALLNELLRRAGPNEQPWEDDVAVIALRFPDAPTPHS